jgi:hypothetical protein
MSARAIRLSAGVLAGLMLAGTACRKDKDDKDDEKKKEQAALEAKAAAKPSGDSRSKEQTNFEVATEEDFEEAMEQQITAESDLNKELDELEKQIGP